MASVVKDLNSKQLISPPTFLPHNVHYETMMGSIAYGVSGDTSDVDVYGFCLPPKDVIFPHLAGHIPGFGKQPTKFEQYQQHHIAVPGSDKEYDLSIYSIVKYFQLCMECNPNMIDSLFTPRRCVLYSSEIGEMVRSSRKKFLHKGAWHKYKGYAYSQLNKIQKSSKEIERFRKFEEERGIPHDMTSTRAVYDPSVRDLLGDDFDRYVVDLKNCENNSSRFAMRKKHGYDVKFSYHVVRLLLEIEQILTEEDLDLERNREVLKGIRRGEWTMDKLKDWASDKEKALERVYEDSKLPWGPREPELKKLLLECLEHHYGSLEKAIVQENSLVQALRTISDEVNKVRKLIG